MSPAGARVLVLGISRIVLDTVMQDLAELGIQVSGSTDPDRIAAEFDALDFDLLAIGGRVDDVTRARVKASFTGRHPAIHLVDAYAPVAVHQILDRLSGQDTEAKVDLDAYLARIGYDGPRTPDLATLQALHRHHLDAIAFEAIDVLLGRGINVAPSAVDAKLIGAGRGGYCFEHNGLFQRVLVTVGFQVKPISARVRWSVPADRPPSARTHMLLEVHLDGRPWLVDVGFGSSVPPAPLRLDTAEPQPTAHETFRVFPFGHELMVQARRDGVWLPMYTVSREPLHPSDCEVANWHTSTHPDSHFTRNLIVARTTADARYTLLDNRFTVRHTDGRSERRFLDASGIETALSDTFRLPVDPDWRPLIERAATVQRR
ncbi:Arylamine N-acetyltransferase [alpha proteobacterium BAL199]|nr:Arylamine N-acetyltransferase [alpha proteobacterium BAL199]